jgi:hypothetical protein
MSMNGSSWSVNATASRAISAAKSALRGESIQNPGELEIGFDILFPIPRKIRVELARMPPKPGEERQRFEIGPLSDVRGGVPDLELPQAFRRPDHVVLRQVERVAGSVLWSGAFVPSLDEGSDSDAGTLAERDSGGSLARASRLPQRRLLAVRE